MLKSSNVQPMMLITSCAFNLELFVLQFLILKSSRSIFYNETVDSFMSTDNLEWRLKNSSGGEEFFNLETKAFYTATKWNFASNMVFGLISLLSSNIIGMLCDRFDVKKIIIFIQVAHILPIGFLILGFLLKKGQLALYVAFAFMAIFGILGGVNAIALICSAYITRVYGDFDNTVEFSKLEAANIFGQMIPNIAGGFIIDRLPIYYVYIFVSSLIIISIIYCICMLESVKGRSKPKAKLSLDGIQFVKESLKLLPCKRHGIQRFTLLSCSLAVVLLSIAVMGANALFYLYLRKSPTFFTNSEVGLFCGITMLLNTISLMIILPFLKRWLNELALCCLSLFARAVKFFCIAFLKNKLLMFSILPLAILCNMEIPILKSYASAQVQSREQGRLMGVFASLQSVGFTISQFCILEVYLLTLGTFPGAAYIICALLCLSILPLLLSIALYERIRLNSNFAINPKDNRKSDVKDRLLRTLSK